MSFDEDYFRFKPGRSVAFDSRPGWQMILAEHRLALNAGRSVQGVFDEAAVKAAVMRIKDLPLPWQNVWAEEFEWWR